MRIVRQEHEYGCIAATAAMLFGLTYGEAVELFGEPKEKVEEQGFGWFVLESMLYDRGFALAKKWEHFQPGNQRRAIWPVEPWAEVHWCEVMYAETSQWAHSVVMLADGSVLDPMHDEPRRLTDYHKVNFVAAVVPVPPAPAA